jgi:hypothetical protein
MHAITQDPVPDQLNQAVNDSPAPPMVRLPVPPNVSLPSPPFRFADTYIAPNEEHITPSPDTINENDHDVDSAAFDYPAYPVVNSESNVYNGSHSDI